MSLNFRSITAAATLIFFAQASHAYYSVLDNNELLTKGNYKLTGTGQIFTDEGGGVDLSTRFDAAINEDFGVRGILGFGEVDFFAGAMLRWVPIPDIENQPAVGVHTGLIYGNDGDYRDFTVRIEPVVSKVFDQNGTIFTPYASLPLGIRFRDGEYEDDTDLVWQLVAGSQLQLPAFKKLQFIGEIGLDLNKAPSYINLGAVLYFDEENGIVIE